MAEFESKSGPGMVSLQSVTSTSATPATFNNLAGFKEHILNITGLTTETVSITVATDAAGANFSPKIKPWDLNTNAAAAATNLNSSCVKISSCMAMAITKSATSNTVKLDLLSY